MKPLVLTFCLVLAPVAAHPHAAPARSFAQLSERLEIGDEIYVLDSQRHELVGSVRSIASDSLEIRLLNGSLRRVMEGDAERVAKVRRATNKGAIAGAIVGTVFGLLGTTGRSFVIEVALTTAIGGGLGEMHGHLETVYRRAPAQPLKALAACDPRYAFPL